MFITYVCREKKNEKRKKKIVYGKKEKKIEEKKKWINVPFPDDLGVCFELKA